MISQRLINEELQAHGHLKARLINRIPRTVEQAKKELMDHYKYAHGLN
jgi:hypothetical protein